MDVDLAGGCGRDSSSALSVTRPNSTTPHSDSPLKLLIRCIDLIDLIDQGCSMWVGVY